jgi:hypothetical protein
MHGEQGGGGVVGRERRYLERRNGRAKSAVSAGGSITCAEHDEVYEAQRERGGI